MNCKWLKSFDNMPDLHDIVMNNFFEWVQLYFSFDANNQLFVERNILLFINFELIHQQLFL
jgi:hypothetical protein